MADIDFPSNPTVGQHYVFGNGTWTWDGVKWTAYPGALAVPDAPSDGQTYGRNNAAWVVASSGGGGGGGGGGITEAPTDGTSYARKSAAWAHLSHADITDWDISIPAAYTLPTASTTVLGGVKVDGSTVTIAGGVITSHAAGGGGASVTVSDTAPVSPNVGDLWWDSVGGQLYLRYNDGNTTQWVPAVNSGVAAASVPPPTGENRIINGDMWLDQRGNGAFQNNANDWPADRWHFVGVAGGDMAWGRNLNGVSTPPGFINYMGFQTTSVGAVGASSAYYVYQPIESDMVTDFLWGTPQAQPATLSFWVKSTLTGTFSGTVGTRQMSGFGATAYPFTYTIIAANTWEQKKYHHTRADFWGVEYEWQHRCYDRLVLARRWRFRFQCGEHMGHAIRGRGCICGDRGGQP